MPETKHTENINGNLSSNERFIQKLNQIIDENLDNERFGVSELADSMDLSRMQMYRRVQKLTGKNVSRYIREKRLSNARDLLIREVGNISEIAYRSGFGSPTYFNKCYRDYYGYTPGQTKDLQEKTDHKEIPNSSSDKKHKNNIILLLTFSFVFFILISGFFSLNFDQNGRGEHKKPPVEVIISDSVAWLNDRAHSEKMNFYIALDTARLNKAIALNNLAIKKDPESIDAIKEKSNIYKILEEFDSALAYADRAIALDSSNYKGYLVKAESYFFMGENEQAVEYYLKAKDLCTDESSKNWINVALARVYGLGTKDPIQAISFLSTAINAQEIPDMLTLFISGNTFCNIGDYERAQAYLELTIIERTKSDKYLAYFDLLMVQGKYDDAVDYINSICDQGFNKEICITGNILLNHYNENYQAEIDWYNKKMDLTFSRFRTSCYVISAFWRLGHLTEARALLEELLVSSRKSKNSLKSMQEFYALAGVYATMGEIDKAKQLIRENHSEVFAFGNHDFILIDPLFDKLRNDPEFLAIVRQTQEEKAALRAEVDEMEERGEISLPL